jgi:hypothetical protein
VDEWEAFFPENGRLHRKNELPQKIAKIAKKKRHNLFSLSSLRWNVAESFISRRFLENSSTIYGWVFRPNTPYKSGTPGLSSLSGLEFFFLYHKPTAEAVGYFLCRIARTG